MNGVSSSIVNVENPYLLRHYHRFDEEAFQWLVSPHPAMQELVQDVIDTLRALRCADALRQRGTVLRTSGGYEIFMDQHTANAIFAFSLGGDRLYLLEMSDSDQRRGSQYRQQRTRSGL